MVYVKWPKFGNHIKEMYEWDTEDDLDGLIG